MSGSCAARHSFGARQCAETRSASGSKLRHEPHLRFPRAKEQSPQLLSSWARAGATQPNATLALWTSSERIVRCSQDAYFRIEKQECGFDVSSQLKCVRCEVPSGGSGSGGARKVRRAVAGFGSDISHLREARHQRASRRRRDDEATGLSRWVRSIYRSAVRGRLVELGGLLVDQLGQIVQMHTREVLDREDGVQRERAPREPQSVGQ